MLWRSPAPGTRQKEDEMDPWLMWVVAIGTVLLPFLLLVVFNGTDVADGRGRRISRRWRAR
jgi:hypothetical protein